MTRWSRAGRLWTFSAVCGVAVAIVIASLARAREESAPVASPGAESAQWLSTPPDAPFVLLRNLRPDNSWGRLALVPLAAPHGPRYLTDLRCVRSHFAGGRGICLTSLGAVGQGVIFDSRFEPQRTLALTGAPSRARVSRNGRRAAVTVFESGHSYADSGFSTRTTIVELAAGGPVADLEDFAVWKDGRRFRRVDFNFWGVTFAADGNRFFATVAFGGTPHLVEGDIDRREVRIIHPNVECPSVSPDDARIAFKRAEGFGWRLWVFDLASRSEHLIEGETRSIDDQVEWLDATRLLYQFPSDEGNILWSVSVDGAAAAQPFIADAWSPAVVR